MPTKKKPVRGKLLKITSKLLEQLSKGIMTARGSGSSLSGGGRMTLG